MSFDNCENCGTAATYQFPSVDDMFFCWCSFAGEIADMYMDLCNIVLTEDEPERWWDYASYTRRG